MKSCFNFNSFKNDFKFDYLCIHINTRRSESFDQFLLSSDKPIT